MQLEEIQRAITSADGIVPESLTLVLNVLAVALLFAATAVAAVIYLHSRSPSKKDPAKLFVRVRLFGLIDAVCVGVFGACGLLISLLLLDPLGIFVSAALVAATVLEFTGFFTVSAGDVSGLRRMALAQGVLVTCVGAYLLLSLATFDAGASVSRVIGDPATMADFPADIRADMEALTEGVMSLVPFLNSVGRAFYAICFLAVVVFQGGLWCFYTRSHSALRPYLAARFGPPHLPPVL